MDNGASSYRRFLDGDESGLVEIIKNYKDGLILYLNSFVGNIHTAEELAEDTFVKIGLRKPKNRGKASFKTWLYTIGRNTAIDYLRQKSKRKEISLDECGRLEAEEESLEQQCIGDERKIIIRRSLDKLKLEYRQVLWLIYFEQFSCKEVSVIMRRSVHAVETLSYRARNALKSELEKEGFGYEDL